ncbi:Signal transduction histidine kinase [Amycolatopsis marina]|uniref:histidine kinase n=1 Tax=Amycolatopsis marina TaxID=490629 RepID=A0A1I1CIY1_9PSEU|nr:nitrate- and nitrite sensing domain-containing protein [Amycolatopsis marina]SFB62427.1 Signal transduction histidine kinase [Amycolatopsis marina]
MPDLAGGERRNAVSSVEPEVADSKETTTSDRPNGLASLSNWPLRAKLVAVFLLPTLAAIFLAGLRVYDGFEETGVYERAQQRIEIAQKVSAVVDKMQIEREAMSAWIVSGRPGDRSGLDEQISRSDVEANELRSAREDVEDLDDEATTELYQQAIARLDGLGDLRVSARDAEFPASAVVISYTGVVDALLGVSDEFGADVTDKGLQDRHEALSSLAHAKEYSAQQNAYLHNAAIRGEYEPAELEGIVSAESNLVSAIDSFTEAATPDNRQLYSNTVSGEEVAQRFQLQELSLQRASAGLPLDIDPDAVGRTSVVTLDLVRAVERDMLADAANYTGGLLSSVQREVIVTSALLVAGLLLALALMYVVARSLLRPLRILRTNALQVAEKHLPEAVDRIMRESDPTAAAERAIDPVPVRTTEEIGQVARAFDVVHGQAVRLAAEQALLRENVNGIFVNLSRRSQRLVERQLGVIDRLEADEQDPDQLASLFELDHLATRLRRNGESLLVLSGAGLAKSVPRPVPAADVIGAAVSEIEQYARVEVGVVPDVTVQGLTIHDLVHVLAELLDNATYFSEPETKVSVRAVVTRRKALAIQITDRGVGMNEQQIAEANRRLADPPDLDVSVTRRMGLYVVARLAQRHGIEVRLRENEDIDGGVIARVVVPAELLAAQPNTEQLRHVQAAEEARPQEEQAHRVLPAAETSGRSPSWPTPEPEPAPAAPAGQSGGLVALEQPISLDDLVGGSASAAGPFLSSGPEPQSRAASAPRTEPGFEPEQTRWPVTEPPAEETSAESGAAESGAAETRASEADTSYMLALPKNEPRYVPVAPDPPAPANASNGVGSALDDDVPTRRLPIYQSVLSRWFSEGGEQSPPHEEVSPHVEAEEVAVEQPEQANRTEEAEAEEGWGAATGNGWEAAQALLESKDEEITPAGLPKRVPNAYLVPGSVGQSEGSAFTDTTSGKPGQGAIARSAAAARSRMVSFQRGYQSGRHALRESPAEAHERDAVRVNGASERSAEHGVEE